MAEKTSSSTLRTSSGSSVEQYVIGYFFTYRSAESSLRSIDLIVDTAGEHVEVSEVTNWRPDELVGTSRDQCPSRCDWSVNDRPN